MDLHMPPTAFPFGAPSGAGGSAGPGCGCSNSVSCGCGCQDIQYTLGPCPVPVADCADSPWSAAPSGQPSYYVIGVGGASLGLDGANHYSNEQVWNGGKPNGHFVGSGGGVSTFWTMPAWQQALNDELDLLASKLAVDTSI